MDKTNIEDEIYKFISEKINKIDDKKMKEVELNIMRLIKEKNKKNTEIKESIKELQI